MATLIPTAALDVCRTAGKPPICPVIFCGREATYYETLSDKTQRFWCSTHVPLGKTEPVGFVKHDQDKVRYELVPAHPLDAVAKVFTFGAKKYADENYLKGTNWRRYIGAALRHLYAFARGEDKDPETGESHLAHVACCALMLMELQRVGTGTDDRVKSLSKTVPNPGDEEG